MDEIVIFDRLSEEDLKKIVEIQLRTCETAEQQKITLDLSDPAKALLAERRLRPGLRSASAARAIQKEILDPLSIDILEGKVREGQIIQVDEKDGRLVFTSE